MTKHRIQVYADAELKRRIELAAAKQDVAVTQYCLAAIARQLADDTLLEAEEIVVQVTPSYDDALLADMRDLRERITARRNQTPITMDVLAEVRAEREDELIRMR